MVVIDLSKAKGIFDYSRVADISHQALSSVSVFLTHSMFRWLPMRALSVASVIITAEFAGQARLAMVQ